MGFGTPKSEGRSCVIFSREKRFVSYLATATDHFCLKFLNYQSNFVGKPDVDFEVHWK
jgi:hypothetical protein